MADITVKNLDEAVLTRLAQRAEAEGISVQELARRALARAAALPDLEDQLASRRAGRVPMSWEESSLVGDVLVRDPPGIGGPGSERAGSVGGPRPPGSTRRRRRLGS